MNPLPSWLTNLFARGSPGEGGDVSDAEDLPGEVQDESQQTFQNIVANEAEADE